MSAAEAVAARASNTSDAAEIMGDAATPTAAYDGAEELAPNTRPPRPQ